MIDTKKFDKYVEEYNSSLLRRYGFILIDKDYYNSYLPSNIQIELLCDYNTFESFYRSVFKFLFNSYLFIVENDCSNSDKVFWLKQLKSICDNFGFKFHSFELLYTYDIAFSKDVIKLDLGFFSDYLAVVNFYEAHRKINAYIECIKLHQNDFSFLLFKVLFSIKNLLVLFRNYCLYERS